MSLYIMVKLYSTVLYKNISIILSSEMSFLTLKTIYRNITYLNMSALLYGVLAVHVPQFNLYCRNLHARYDVQMCLYYAVLYKFELVPKCKQLYLPCTLNLYVLSVSFELPLSRHGSAIQIKYKF